MNMDRSELTQTVRGIFPGTKLRLTFKPGTGRKGVLDSETKAATGFFVMMKDKNIIFPNESDWATFYAVATSGFWDQDSNRVVDVIVPDGFDPDWFVHRLHYGLEKIEILN